MMVIGIAAALLMIVVVVLLAQHGGPTRSVAHVLYDAEHPTRPAR